MGAGGSYGHQDHRCAWPAHSHAPHPPAHSIPAPATTGPLPILSQVSVPGQQLRPPGPSFLSLLTLGSVHPDRGSCSAPLFSPPLRDHVSLSLGI